MPDQSQFNTDRTHPASHKLNTSALLPSHGQSGKLKSVGAISDFTCY